MPPAMEMQSLNHWASQGGPKASEILKSSLKSPLSPFPGEVEKAKQETALQEKRLGCLRPQGRRPVPCVCLGGIPAHQAGASL